MLFRIVSDIHLEHHADGTYTQGDVHHHMSLAVPKAETDKDSVLILAGDISPYHPQRRFMLEQVSPRFKKVIYVAGNHEHWGNWLCDWDACAEQLEGEFGNVAVNRMGEAASSYVMVDGELDTKHAVILATMWAPYGRDNKDFEEELTDNADCRRTRPDKTRLKCDPKHFQDLYTREIAGIKHNLIHNYESGRESVVVTHHVPGHFLRLPGLEANAWDDMFMSEEAASFMYEEWAPKFWFFGHTHRSWDIQHGKTRCISNPYGYPYETYRGWQQVKVV